MKPGINGKDSTGVNTAKSDARLYFDPKCKRFTPAYFMRIKT